MGLTGENRARKSLTPSCGLELPTTEVRCASPVPVTGPRLVMREGADRLTLVSLEMDPTVCALFARWGSLFLTELRGVLPHRNKRGGNHFERKAV